MTNCPKDKIVTNTHNMENSHDVNNSTALSKNTEQDISDAVEKSSANLKNQQKDDAELSFNEEVKTADDLLPKNDNMEISHTVNNLTELIKNTEQEMLDAVAKSNAIFKSQQKDDLDLSFNEKLKSADDLLPKNDIMEISHSVNNLTELSKNTEQEILDTVAKSSAIFKSQQKDDPELSFNEKRKIAEDLLYKNHHQFLSRFGKNLKAHLLNYFTEKYDDYETTYHVKKLTRYLNNETRKIDRKNRRYEAWKEMIQKGDYFSETAMMKRNPLLYDNLIGRFLTEDQKKARDNIDTTNITFVNLLLEGIERDGLRDLKKSQEEAEDDVREENDSDSESDDTEREYFQRNGKKGENNWGEFDKSSRDTYDAVTRERRNLENCGGVVEIDYEEQQMLRQEFISQMYESFLEGRDADFDYRYYSYD